MVEKAQLIDIVGPTLLVQYRDHKYLGEDTYAFQTVELGPM